MGWQELILVFFFIIFLMIAKQVDNLEQRIRRLEGKKKPPQREDFLISWWRKQKPYEKILIVLVTLLFIFWIFAIFAS
ncbi:MAG: hypothetical protein KJ905_02150 [Nanoarchaeota archaeon]|nr:hypothetical protein [Nanoarchaeota archaeon]MBU1501553.1 hypothetical protein [Nanoarchaeota archaeon]MBU2459144.1 hypothetical protein [Nanoarchaeota archaeon]